MKHIYFKIYAISLALFITVALSTSLQAQDTLQYKTGNVENICLVYPFNSVQWLQTYSGLEANNEGLIVNKNAATLTSLPIKVPLLQAEPFLSFAAILSMENAAVNWGTLSVRTSIDGVHYSDWTVLSFETNTGTDYFGELISFDKYTQWIEYKLDITSTTTEFVIKKIKLSFINPGKTETKTLLKLKKKMVVGSEIAGISKPDVLSRTEWGCGSGQIAPLWGPKYSAVTHLVIHHTAGSNDITQDYPATVRSIWSYHTYSNKWGDIGYNYLIDNDGNIYEGRAGGNNVIGAHCSKNSGTMGVSVMGTYIDVVPSNNSLSALTDLLSWKCVDSNIKPIDTVFHASSGKELPTICGHRDVKETECPGNAFYGEMVPIRLEVKLLMSKISDNINLSESAKDILAQGDTIAVNVITSLSDFTVNTDAAWVKLNKSGKTISISLEANSLSSSRLAIVTVSGEGSFSKQILLTQAGYTSPVSIKTNERNAMVCYPNPVSETLHIQPSTIKEKKIYIEIKNMLGQIVYAKMYQNVTDAALEISVKGLSKGTYILTVRGSNAILATQKLIKN